MGGSYFFGGGTGGHIYPAIAVAEKIIRLEPDAEIHFFCSSRDIDSQILSKAGFKFTTLPACGFSARLGGLIRFCRLFLQSYKIAREIIAESKNPVVIGIGGFVAAPVCRAGHKLKAPVVLLNLDSVPGKANKMIAHWADIIFVQFEETARYFARREARVEVAGCPLRSGFEKPDPSKAMEELGLDAGKKILLVTGASSGSASINETVCSLLPRLDLFADEWQVVHLAGRANFEPRKVGAGLRISHRVLDYYDEMANLLSAADLVIGRSGAVSVAEYAAAGVPSICMPYPHHKDRHQYFNAEQLVDAGAAIVVDDLPDAKERAEWLWEELEPLLKNDEKLKEMKEACQMAAKGDAALKLAEKLLAIGIDRRRDDL